MKRRVMMIATAVLALGSAAGVARATQQPPAPAPKEDRIGFPEGYKDMQVLYTLDRPDNKQVRVIYGNAEAAGAASNSSFPYGSMLVMETWATKKDADGNVLLDANGRYQRDTVAGVFVMKKGEGYGTAYEQNRTGEWEYVAYRPDGTYLTPPENTAACAICHRDTPTGKDWTYRTDLYFKKASGALPHGLIQNYLYLPGAITVKAGTTVTWYNDDAAFHTITATDGAWDSGKMVNGTSFSRMFDTPGTYTYKCSFHAAMTAMVVVE